MYMKVKYAPTSQWLFASFIDALGTQRLLQFDLTSFTSPSLLKSFIIDKTLNYNPSAAFEVTDPYLTLITVPATTSIFGFKTTIDFTDMTSNNDLLTLTTESGVSGTVKTMYTNSSVQIVLYDYTSTKLPTTATLTPVATTYAVPFIYYTPAAT